MGRSTVPRQGLPASSLIRSGLRVCPGRPNGIERERLLAGSRSAIAYPHCVSPSRVIHRHGEAGEPELDRSVASQIGILALHDLACMRPLGLQLAMLAVGSHDGLEPCSPAPTRHSRKSRSRRWQAHHRWLGIDARCPSTCRASFTRGTLERRMAAVGGHTQWSAPFTSPTFLGPTNATRRTDVMCRRAAAQTVAAKLLGVTLFGSSPPFRSTTPSANRRPPAPVVREATG